MGDRIRSFDWASHPLGPLDQWPETLRMALNLCLNSSFPTSIYWGPERYVLYNDAYTVIAAEKHPWILGKPAAQGWSDIWHIIGPQFDRVLQGEGLALYEQMLPMVRGGLPWETWWNYSSTPIRHADHTIGGTFNQAHEITELVVVRRERDAELVLWRETFRQAPTPVVLLRGANHVYEFANDAYVRLVGGRDVTGKTVREALPEMVAQGFVALLDNVYATGERYLGSGATVKLRREPEGPLEDCVVDFMYQPMRNSRGDIDGILVMVTDVTARARAESALRLSNWQLGEERARLSALIEAEQRARLALRRFNDTLEAHVKSRTAELTRALEAQSATNERLRAMFETDFLFQGFLDTDGILRDANPASLEAIGCRLPEVVGKPFWETPWFTATPGAPERVREALEQARQGRKVQTAVTLNLPNGMRSFHFSLRPVVNGRGEIVGLVPEAIELVEPREQLAA